MNFSLSNPFVRLVHIFDEKEMLTETMLLADCRLFFIVEGRADAISEGSEYHLKKSDIIILPCGTRYRISSSFSRIIGINFDYETTPLSPKAPIYPVKPDAKRKIEKPSFDDAPALNSALVLENAAYLAGDINRILDVFEKGKIYSSRLCSGLLLSVISDVLQRSASPKNKINVVDSVIEYVSENYAAPISNERIGRLFGYHPNYLNRLFIAQTGFPLHQYLLNFRISKASSLLVYTDKSVSEIAEICGFSSGTYFAEMFKKLTGLSPSEIRRSSR